jgi:YegS/Rv2252/BmrU family lipid kinase
LLQPLIFIVNPRSGTDRKKALDHLIGETIDPDRFAPEIWYTERAGHGTELARKAAAAGAFAAIAVGGDGSVNDVANGLLGTGTALGIIPKGSGNGLARTLGIPLDVKGALERINRGEAKPIDAGFANDHLFLSNGGVGFDVGVCEQFSESNRRGFWTYFKIIARHYFAYQAPEWTIEAGGKTWREKAFMVVAANGVQFGYEFKIAPTADLSDGLLDLVVVRRFSKWVGGLIALRSLNGSLLKSPFVRHQKVDTFTVSHPHLTAFQIDGEVRPCAGKVVFRLEPLALQVLC